MMLVPNAKRKEAAVGGTVILTLPGCPLYLDLTHCPPLPLGERLVHYIVGAGKGTPVFGNDGAVHTLPLAILGKTVSLGI